MPRGFPRGSSSGIHHDVDCFSYLLFNSEPIALRHIHEMQRIIAWQTDTPAHTLTTHRCTKGRTHTYTQRNELVTLSSVSHRAAGKKQDRIQQGIKAILTGNALTTLHSRLSIKKQLLKCSSHLYAAWRYGRGGGSLQISCACQRENTHKYMSK